MSQTPMEPTPPPQLQQIVEALQDIAVLLKLIAGKMGVHFAD